VLVCESTTMTTTKRIMLGERGGVFTAIEKDDVQLLREKLSLPTSSPHYINPNSRSDNSYGKTILSLACTHNAIKCVEYLLAHPDINVNGPDSHHRSTPFMDSCASARKSVVALLLKDARVDTAMRDDYGCSAMWWCLLNKARGDEIDDVAEYFIASGRDLGSFSTPAFTMLYSGSIHDMWQNEKVDSKFRVTPRMKDILDRLALNPNKLRQELRIKHGFSQQDATDLFASVVFLCDGLLTFNTHAITTCGTPFFFLIMKKLPMELQMIICHRVYGSPKDSIPSHNSEPAFQRLAKFFRTTTTTKSK